MDMRTMVSLYAAPDAGPFGWDLAHFYGLPTFGTAGASDAKVFDAQAAAEAALTLFDEILNGANLIHDVGYLDCAMTGSLEFLAFCDEVIGWLRRYFRKLEISEETLALELIDEVGPDGHFIDARHTLRHVREDWVPTLSDRYDYRRWANMGSTTLQQRAKSEGAGDHRRPPGRAAVPRSGRIAGSSSQKVGDREMLYQNRDMGINYIKARKDHRCYGMGLGIIILDDVYPGFPGDVRNASRPFPLSHPV